MTGLVSMVTSEYSSIPSFSPGLCTVEALRKNSLQQDKAACAHTSSLLLVPSLPTQRILLALLYNYRLKCVDKHVCVCVCGSSNGPLLVIVVT